MKTNFRNVILSILAAST